MSCVDSALGIRSKTAHACPLRLTLAGHRSHRCSLYDEDIFVHCSIEKNPNRNCHIQLCLGIRTPDIFLASMDLYNMAHARIQKVCQKGSNFYNVSLFIYFLSLMNEECP